LIRRLPLAAGYKAEFPIFPIVNGASVSCRIEVTGQEKLAVAAGTFNCHKLNLQVLFSGNPVLNHKLWFSADNHRYLVKYDSNEAIMELTEVTTIKEPSRFSDEQIGLSLQAPKGWFFYSSASQQYKFSLYLIPPEFKTWSILAAVEKGSATLSAREVANGDVEILKGYFKSYTVRPDSWSELKISNFPAVRYIADYDDKGKKKVEYRTYIVGKSMIYWFVFRIDKDKFQENRSTFDSIVQSLTVK